MSSARTFTSSARSISLAAHGAAPIACRGRSSMTDERSLSGKRVVITGAGRGLGRALAIVAADQGAEVVLLGRDPAALQAVAGAIATRTGRAAAVVSCDLADPN